MSNNIFPDISLQSLNSSSSTPLTPPASVFAKSAVITGTFWSSCTILQRASGLIGIHAGRPYPLTAGCGLLLTSAAVLLSHFNADGLLKKVSAWLPNQLAYALDSAGGASGSGGPRWPWDKRPLQDDIRLIALSLATFTVLERRMYRTILPSSLITTGVYAHTPWHWHRRMPSVLAATSEVASAAQRTTIQRLGKLHGCHHCGGRQVISSLNFIADHMPPTKQVKDMNMRWYRRFSGIEAKQQLLPQCQRCFSKQGSAVRSGVHALVYHARLRIWHFAPAIAYLALNAHLGQSFLRETGAMAVLDSIAQQSQAQRVASEVKAALCFID